MGMVAPPDHWLCVCGVVSDGMNRILIPGVVQAWVAHFVTPLKCTYDEFD